MHGERRQSLSLEQVHDLIDFATASGFDKTQRSGIFSEGNPESFDIITSNEACYDDTVEGILDTDEVLCTLYKQIGENGASPELSKKIRQRRTVAVRILLEACAVAIAYDTAA